MEYAVKANMGPDGHSSEQIPPKSRKSPGQRPGLFHSPRRERNLEVHPAHATHAAARHWAVRVFFLGQLGDHRLGGDQQAGNRCSILQRRAHDLGGVDDTLGNEIAVFMRLRVVAEVVLGVLKDLADDHRAVFTGVGKDLARRGLQRLADNGDPGLLIVVVRLQSIERLRTENDDQKVGIAIVRRALQWPARQIVQNAGEDGSVVVGKVLENSKYAFGYNAQTGEYGDLVAEGVIDPAKVVRCALQDAASVAGLLITTEAMIAEAPKKDAGGPPMPGGGMGGMVGMGGMDF